MSKLSFIDKLRILLNISKSSSLYIFILALLIFVGIIFITTNKKNAKRNKRRHNFNTQNFSKRI